MIADHHLNNIGSTGVVTACLHGDRCMTVCDVDLARQPYALSGLLAAKRDHADDLTQLIETSLRHEYLHDL